MPKSTNVYHNVSSKISSGTHIPSSLNINILSPPETKKHDFQNKFFIRFLSKVIEAVAGWQVQDTQSNSDLTLHLFSRRNTI